MTTAAPSADDPCVESLTDLSDTSAVRSAPLAERTNGELHEHKITVASATSTHRHQTGRCSASIVCTAVCTESLMQMSLRLFRSAKTTNSRRIEYYRRRRGIHAANLRIRRPAPDPQNCDGATV